MTGPALAWAVETLVASALLMAAVLLARSPTRRAFGPQVAYALWALPALRLLLPPLPADWREQVQMPISRASELVLVLPAAAAEPTPTAVPWAAIALAAWAGGAAIFFVLHLVRHRTFCRRLLADARLIDDVEGIRVIESGAASGPLAFGMRRRFVAFPRDFAERYDAEERELALLHELGHHRARDLWANWVALAVLALHWFNPLAWRAFRAFRCDQELANDARVLAGRGRTDRHIYACAIVKAAHGGHVSAACHLHTIADLKGRLRMLTRATPSRRRLAAGATAIAGFVAAGLCVTASGTRAAAAVTERIGDAVGVDLAQAAPPVPATPTAPAAPTAPPAPDRPQKNAKRIVVVKDGVSRTYTGAEADAYAATHALPVPPTPPVPPIPTNLVNVKITAGDCGPDKGGKTFIVRRPETGGPATVICTDRITTAAMKGQISEADGQNIERQALTSALTGLRSSRANVVANASMTTEARTEALAGIDEAIAEIQGDLANVGKDD